jgi:ADP-glucose pyrophosphorylase
MVKLDRTDHLMLARQLPTQTVALILAGGRGTRLKDLTAKRDQTCRALWWQVPHHRLCAVELH